MKIKSLFIALLFLPLLGVAAESPAAKETEFKGDALAVKKRLEELFEVSKKVNNEGAEKNKARLEIEGALDWDKISELCLGKDNYKKNSGKNFQEFKNLLKEVIVKTAYSRLDKFWQGTTYKIDTIDIKGSEAKVATKFFVKDEPFVLEYFLYKKNNKWSIFDISYEELRYSVNINEQIDAFLKEKSFSGLLEKLKKRRTELDENAKSAKKG